MDEPTGIPTTPPPYCHPTDKPPAPATAPIAKHLTHEQIVTLLGEDCPKDHEVYRRARKWVYPYEDTKPLAFLRAVGRWADTGFEREFVRSTSAPEPGERKRYRLLQKWPADPYEDGDDVPESWRNANPDILFKVYGRPVETEPYTPTPWTESNTDYLPGDKRKRPADMAKTGPVARPRSFELFRNIAPGAPVPDDDPVPEDDPVYRALAELLGVSVQDAWRGVTLEKDPSAIAALLGVCAGIDEETIERRYGVRAPADPYHEAAHALADLVVSKQEQYGDSFGRSGAIVRALYPNGIPPEKLDDALTIIRVLDKIFRIATNPTDLGGENPWRDIAGYALLSIVRTARA